MKRIIGNILPIAVILIGLGFLLYPSVSNFLVELNGSRAVASYDEAVADMDEQRYEELMSQALAYNERLAASASGIDLLEAEAGSGLTSEYEQLLDVTGTGMMGYITIPKIGITMPIYHGVSEPVLQVGAGHLPDTSLPVGGASSHCVLSGHRGLPSAKLFTDLDQLAEGDIFYLKVLDQVLAYKVYAIETVLPTETSSLAIQQGRDLVTLVTCTPYGVNSHRLLIHAERTDYVPEDGDIVIAPGLNIPWPYLLLMLALVVLAIVVGIIRHRAKKLNARELGSSLGVDALGTSAELALAREKRKGKRGKHAR